MLSIDFEFLYFLIFPFLFSPYLYIQSHFLSYSLIRIHIRRQKQVESCVGRTKQEWITGTWMKGGGLCYSSWMFCSWITFPCPSLDSLHPGLPWPWRYLSPWNLSTDDMSLSNGSIIFSPSSWNEDVMTGAGTAIWDQRKVAQMEYMTRKKWVPISVERPAPVLYERELKLYWI